jgi:16S rRNA (adenine1518-N6/adenine1519-N6)-dimethyltransferase
VRELARRHGIRPSRSLGQHFLIDPNLARRIASLAELRPGDRVVEIGAGLGSLTVALAEAGGRVLAIEFDRALTPALREVAGPLDGVEILETDAMAADWRTLLRAGEWTLVANLPYNISTPLVLRLLEDVPRIERYLVMVQREAGERLAAEAGEDAYGAVSVKVAYWAEAEVLRRVPPTVFWPKPKVESVLVRLTPRPAPVAVNRGALFRVVEAGFAERRKTMRNALRRLGLSPSEAAEALEACRLSTQVRAEEIDLQGFARLASWPAVQRALGLEEAEPSSDG